MRGIEDEKSIKICGEFKDPSQGNPSHKTYRAGQSNKARSLLYIHLQIGWHQIKRHHKLMKLYKNHFSFHGRHCSFEHEPDHEALHPSDSPPSETSAPSQHLHTIPSVAKSFAYSAISARFNLYQLRSIIRVPNLGGYTYYTAINY